jgi:uncharacterized protein YecT (DUF1311 family)
MNRRAAAATCLAIVLAGCGHTAADAQVSLTPNCVDPQSQAEINMCARADHDAADAAMDAVLQQTLAQYREQDRAYADLGSAYVGAEKLLIASQEKWANGRSEFCGARGLTNYGGSMRPAVVASCFAMMARSRTEELRWLLD